MKKHSLVLLVCILVVCMLVYLGEFVFSQGSGNNKWEILEIQKVEGLDFECQWYLVEPVDGASAWVWGKEWNRGDSAIIRTDDGGHTWQARLAERDDDYRIEDISALDKNIAWAVATVEEPDLSRTTGLVLKTVDGGKNWSEQFRCRGELLCVCAVDADTVWVAGTSIYKTTDGGKNWAEQWQQDSDAYMPVSLIKALDDRVAWACAGVANEEGLNLLKTVDGGSTWTKVCDETTLNNINFDMAVADSQTLWVTCGPMVNAKIFKTVDGGSSWMMQHEQYWFITGVEARDANTAWAVDAGLNMMKTTDGGNSWVSEELGLEYDGVGFTDVRLAKDGTLWALGRRGIIVRSARPEERREEESPQPPQRVVLREAAHDSLGATAPASKWYLAEGSTDGGMETFLLVQNPGDSPVHVNIKFQTSTGEKVFPQLQGVEIPSKSRRNFKVNDYVTDYEVSTFVEALDGEVICERAMYINL